MRRWWLLVWVVLSLGPSGAAHAFVYLEHGWFTDRACGLALSHLDGQTDPAIQARVLALRLLCPAASPTAYCVDAEKQATAPISRQEGDDYPVTLGDLAAIPDHVTRFGPIRGLPRAAREGLVAQVAGLLTEDLDDGPGGMLEDVAERACEQREVDWARVEADLAAFVAGRVAPAPDWALSPLARAPAKPGPSDPDGLYSFDNPHFLDMVLRNHTHFGRQAYETWTGFHASALDLAARACDETMALDEGALSDLVEGTADADADFDEMGGAERRRRGCAALATQVRRRLKITTPLAPALAARVPAALFGLVFEAAGLHFLQDGFAGGHIRTDRTARGLAESRYDHNTDGEHGVQAHHVTREGVEPFVAFGDGRLLGDAHGERPAAWTETLAPGPVTDGLLARQRGLVVLASAASLVDWALGGTMRTPEAPGCGHRTGAAVLPCEMLPLAPITVGGPPDDGPRADQIRRGTLPTPPPPFEFESLVFTTALDPADGATRLGVRLTLLNSMDRYGDWMRSHRLALHTRDAGTRWVMEYGHLFHFRWGARFLLNLGPQVYGALHGLGDDVGAELGVAPQIGLTLLPEGWLRMPLEVTFDYTLPVRLASRRGVGLDGHFIGVSLGLAFM